MRSYGITGYGIFPTWAELPLNSANSANLINHWSMNWTISHVSCWQCGGILVSYTRGGWVAGSSPFTVMKYFCQWIQSSVKHLGKIPGSFIMNIYEKMYLEACNEYDSNYHLSHIYHIHWNFSNILRIEFFLFWIIKFYFN